MLMPYTCSKFMDCVFYGSKISQKIGIKKGSVCVYDSVLRPVFFTMERTVCHYLEGYYQGSMKSC